MRKENQVAQKHFTGMVFGDMIKYYVNVSIFLSCLNLITWFYVKTTLGLSKLSFMNIKYSQDYRKTDCII